MQKFMTIGELANRMGVSVRTLQYYDKEGLLSPSALSEGGHRLYSSKDVVKLHQILSFKYLGFTLDEIKSRIFSLDTPEQAEQILSKQYKAIEEQIELLQETLEAIGLLRSEVTRIHEVDFQKYAEIIELLRMRNQDYWVWKLFDSTLTGHIKERFSEKPGLAEQISANYKEILEEAVSLKRQNEQPDSEKSLALAGKWWQLVMDFTGGDMTLIPNLIAYNQDKSGWNEEIAAKQKEADDYINKTLFCYLQKNGISVPEME